MSSTGQEHIFKIFFSSNEYVTSLHKDLTIQHKDLRRRHKDLTCQDNYLTSGGGNMLP